MMKTQQELTLLKLDFNERSDAVPQWLNLQSINPNKLWQYPNKERLQQIICDKFSISKEQLLVTNGGDEAIELLFKSAKIEKKTIVLPLPAFSQYWSGVQNWQLNAKYIEPLEDMRLDIQTLIESIEEDSIVIVTSPNNPTGEQIPIETVERICKKAQQKNSWVLLDQAYIEFTGNIETGLDLIDRYRNLLLLRSLSKAYGLAAIRLGYLMADKALIAQLQKLSMPFNVSALNLEIAQLAFSEEARYEVKSYCNKIAQNRQLVQSYLLPFNIKVVESGANFLFLQGDSNKLRLIDRSCQRFNIQIKNNLVGLSRTRSVFALRITIPYNIERLLAALQLALKPDLLCFDMDGVLIDTSESYDQCIKKTVKVFTGVDVNSEQVSEVRARGGFNNDWKLTQQLIAELGSEINYQDIIETFQHFYQGDDENPGFKSKEKPLLESALKKKIFVDKTREINTAVVTGRPKIEALEGLDLLSIKNTNLISDDDVNQSKPDPEGINKVKRFFNAENCWMLGDSPDDMLAAKSAGAIAIGIGSDNLYQFGADLVLNNVNQLESLI